MDLHHCSYLWRHWHYSNVFLCPGYDRCVIPPTQNDPPYNFLKSFSGVDLAEEDRKFMQYLADNGWKGDVGEDSVGDDSSVDDSELEKQ